MLRRHASLIVAFLLVCFVAGACIVRTRPTHSRRGQPVYNKDHRKDHRKARKEHRKDRRKDRRKNR